jgi:hypothetical protein
MGVRASRARRDPRERGERRVPGARRAPLHKGWSDRTRDAILAGAILVDPRQLPPITPPQS